MLGIGNADLERALILLVAVALLVLLVRMTITDRRFMPQVPPTVSPMLHPLDEDVRQLKHFRASVEQRLPDIEHRVVEQAKQLAAIQQDIGEIKQATGKTERMVEVLIENGLRRERQA